LNPALTYSSYLKNFSVAAPLPDIAMDTPSTAVLPERFETHLRVLNEQVVKSNNISATRKETQLLPRAESAGLLAIPTEIRLQIYHYCLPRKRVIVVSDPCFDTSYPPTNEADDSPAVEDYEEETSSIDYGGCDEDPWVTQENRNNLFLVSKQISEEALDYVYGENIFKLDINANGEHLLRQNFPEHNIRRMLSPGAFRTRERKSQTVCCGRGCSQI
jgi:hypothetical protein